MPTRKFNPITITQFSDFIHHIEDFCKNDLYLYRGQTSDWSLMPKIGRLKMTNSLLVTEREMMDEFQRLSKPYLTTIPTNELEWLSLAQHHGMATRLLDWTTNPLAAAWFTVSKPCPEKYGVIWIFEPPTKDIIKAGQAQKINPYDGVRSKIFQPNITTARILMQNGWFTLHSYHRNTNRFVEFERNTIYNKYLTKIKIPKEEFSSFRFQLDRLGINERSLFSGVDGTAKYVEWLYSLLEDESLTEKK